MRELQLDKGKNCLIGECAPERAGAPDLKMLLYNKLPGYLPLRIQYIDNRNICLYALEGKIALAELLERESVDAELVERLYFNLLEIIRRGREYLLNPVHLVLDPEHMYWDIQEKRLALCYFPEYQSGIDEKLEQFSQYLLRHINHKDKSGTALMYGLYDLIAENGFEEHRIEKYLKDFVERDQRGRISRKRDQQENIKQYACEQWDTTEENDRCHGEDGRSKKYERRGQRIQQGKTRNEGTDFPIGLRNISGERGIPQWAVISEKGITIGRGEENEMILPCVQVSRQHAQIELDEEQILLTDMDSVNGVWLNGRRLFVGRPVRCRCGDEVSFAGISYRIERQEM